MRVFSFCVSLLVSQLALADTLADIRQGGVLIWGADQEGGGPYVYPEDGNPNNLIGFEVDLAARLAESLKAKPLFTQGLWETLPKLLEEKKVHVVLNGYEWTPERAKEMEASIPYYVYSLQLLVQKDNKKIKSWQDLKTPPKAGKRWKVGVLRESAAEEYMKLFSETVEVVSFDGSTTPMFQVETKQLDATLTDSPIAAFYADDYPKLRAVGEPVGKGYYVIYANKGETALIAELNRILIEMINNGELEKIYQKHRLWDAPQAELAEIAKTGQFQVTTDALGIVSAAGVAFVPGSEATSAPSGEEEEPTFTYGVEQDFNSRYIWRGTALSFGPMEQPSAWVSAYGATFSAWASIDLTNSIGGQKFCEVDFTLEYEKSLGDLTLVPAANVQVYPNPLAGTTIVETSLEASYPIVGPLSAVTNHYLYVITFDNAYYGTLGVALEQDISVVTLEASSSLGFGSAKLYQDILEFAPLPGFVAEGALAGTYYFLDAVYVRGHGEIAAILNKELSDITEERVIFNLGLALGLDL